MSEITKGVLIGVLTALILGVATWFLSGVGNTFKQISKISDLEESISTLKSSVTKIGTGNPTNGPRVISSDAVSKPGTFIFADCPSGHYVSGVAYKGQSQKYCSFCNSGIQVKCSPIK